MRPFAPTPLLRAVAQRVIWFKEPDEALADPVHFLAHVMTYGTPEDLATLRAVAAANAFREVLDDAPAGIFDARSWAYWHLVITRRSPAPPMPVRIGLQLVHRFPDREAKPEG